MVVRFLLKLLLPPLLLTLEISCSEVPNLGIRTVGSGALISW